MLVPASFKIRHKIIQLLTDLRSKQQNEKHLIETAQLTIDEISTELKIDRKLVDQQLNVLWTNEEVYDINTNNPTGDPTKTKYIVSPKGISTASSKSILYDGQIINSQLFNNYASGIFQIIVGILAVLAFYQNSTSIDSLREENKRVQIQLDLLLRDRIELKGHGTIQNNSVDTTTKH